MNNHETGEAGAPKFETSYTVVDSRLVQFTGEVVSAEVKKSKGGKFFLNFKARHQTVDKTGKAQLTYYHCIIFDYVEEDIENIKAGSSFTIFGLLTVKLSSKGVTFRNVSVERYYEAKKTFNAENYESLDVAANIDEA